MGGKGKKVDKEGLWISVMACSPVLKVMTITFKGNRMKRIILPIFKRVYEQIEI